jgi:hypothetical protein
MYSSILSLASTLDGLGSQHPAPAALPPGKRPVTHCMGGWMGPRACLDVCGKSRSQRDSIAGPSSRKRVTIPSKLFRPTETELFIRKLPPVSLCPPQSQIEWSGTEGSYVILTRELC